jgi:sulfonate transport system substrate-binding protein
MVNATTRSPAHLRKFATSLFAAAVLLGWIPNAFAADAVVLRVGDQKGGNRSLLDISGLSKDLPYKIEWSEFPAAAPILEALNAGALDVGKAVDRSFTNVVICN